MATSIWARPRVQRRPWLPRLSSLPPVRRRLRICCWLDAAQRRRQGISIITTSGVHLHRRIPIMYSRRLNSRRGGTLCDTRSSLPLHPLGWRRRGTSCRGVRWPLDGPCIR